MSNPEENDNVHSLADLNVATVRRENEAVAEQIDSLEAEVEELRKEKSDLEDDLDEEESRANEAEKLLKEFAENQRKEQLARIRSANEAVDDEEEVDLSTLEEASVDQLETVADMLEAAAGTETTVGNDPADLDTVEGGEKTLEDELAEKADEFGLGRSYRRVLGDDEEAEAAADEAPPEAGLERGAGGDIPMDDIVATLGDS